jgi:hypothetical protein
LLFWGARGDELLRTPYLRTSENPQKAKFGKKYGFVPVLWARNPTNALPSEGYHEQVGIIPKEADLSPVRSWMLERGYAELPEASQPPIPPFNWANLISGSFVLPR